MNAVDSHRRMPAAWAAPAGVLTAQVDRRTGMAVDASCPGSGQTYTEYFVHRLPPSQICYPSAAYPQMTMGDTGWVDYESGAWSYVDTTGTTDLQRRGIDWPELEEKRRREGTTPPRTPLPGSVEDPYGTESRPVDATPMIPSRPGRIHTPPPIRDGAPVTSDGQRRSGDGSSGTSTRRPRVIGRPVDGSRDGGVPPPPPPPPSDSGGTGLRR
jgi:hypothetical protein